MANYWAITIGINQYRYLQPLMHAQNDALFMHRFFADTVGVAADNCVLLSDLTTSVGHQVVYPDKPALSAWVQTITQKVQADDVLWFFFSGYGVQLDGADYLMPIDGDPKEVAQTGLAAADLVDTLSALPTDKVLLVLDINRSQGAFSGQTIGQQVMDLAAARQLPLLLSCQPEQYSHETFGVRHGLFTAALLEALQQRCKTLEEISRYVTKRLPELCEHHWRPIQNPVSLIPEAQLSTPVIPESRLIKDVISRPVESEANAGVGVVAGTGVAAVGAAQADGANRVSRAGELGRATVLAGSTGTLVGRSEVEGRQPVGSAESSSSAVDRLDAQAGSAVTGGVVGDGNGYGRGTSCGSGGDASSAIVPAGKNDIVSVSEEDRQPAITGARLRNWGLAILALLMLGVLLKQPFMLTAWQGLRERIAALSDRSEGDSETVSGSALDSSETAPPETDSDMIVPIAEETGETSDEAVESGSDASAPSAAEDEITEGTPAAETPAETTPATPAQNNAVATDVQTEGVQSDESTKALLAQANKALSQRQYSEALILLQQVPKDQRDSAFSTVLTKARAGAAEAQQYNASVLTDARTSIQPTQASQFTDAIAKARLIKKGEPYYEEAQADIRSWSQIILDIAEGRATSGNLDGAIAAAKVMPYDNAEFYQKAQERVAFWQQRQQSRNIITAAQAIPRTGQASSYQQGIVKLREVPIEHPEYETAQRLADEWSDRIFSIAQARAAQGRPEAAIQAAVLVPAGTTAYEPTQQAIKRWQSE